MSRQYNPHQQYFHPQHTRNTSTSSVSPLESQQQPQAQAQPPPPQQQQQLYYAPPPPPPPQHPQQSYYVEQDWSQSFGLPMYDAAPQLVRTTALSQTGFGDHDAPKAAIKIIGNLDTMTQNWTPEELASKRRLVEFTRSQQGHMVVAEFRRLDPKEYTQTTRCISCILWSEKSKCYVTSVDCIYLLEQLINTKFTVEEKNRIRRNLEGYHPQTVSKGKPDSGRFFKTIMEFPAPKPRNIEKDVKVFEWELLGKALEKIVGKYSAVTGGYYQQQQPAYMYQTVSPQLFQPHYDTNPGMGAPTGPAPGAQIPGTGHELYYTPNPQAQQQQQQQQRMIIGSHVRQPSLAPLTLPRQPMGLGLNPGTGNPTGQNPGNPNNPGMGSQYR